MESVSVVVVVGGGNGRSIGEGFEKLGIPHRCFASVIMREPMTSWLVIVVIDNVQHTIDRVPRP
jgi:hypothetical protein